MAKRFRIANGHILVQESAGWKGDSVLYPNRAGLFSDGRTLTEDRPVRSAGGVAVEGCHLVTFDEMAARYCNRQVQTPAALLEIFKEQRGRFDCDGWFLLECQDMSSSSMGTLTILPFGGTATYKEIPTHPVSPRGLASDMATAEQCILASELPEVAAPWVEPPPPPKAKAKRVKKTGWN